MIEKQKNPGLWLLIIGVVFIIPYAYHPLTIDPVLSFRFNIWAVLAFVLFSVITGKKLKTECDFKIFSRRIFIVLICFALITMVSFTRAINLSEAVFDFQKQVLVFLFFYIVSVIAGLDTDNVYLIAKSVVVSGIFFSIIGISGFFINQHYLLMANKNLFSSALFLMSPFVLFGAFNFSGLWKILSLISTTGIHCAIFLTRTRSVWLAICLSAVFVFLCLNFKKKQQKKNSFNTKTIRLIAMSTVLFIVSGSFFFMDQNFYSPILSTKTLEKRIELWENTINMIKDNPFFGVGPGQWKINYPHYGHPATEKNVSGRKIQTVFQRPHNDYLGVLSEYGLFGFFFFIGFFIIILFYGIKIISHDNNDKTTLFISFMLYGITGYMVIAFFSFPKERIFHNVFLALISGSIVSVYHRLFPLPKTNINFPIKWFHLGMMVMLVFFIGTGFMRMNSEVHAKKAIQAVKSGKWNIAIHESDLADSPLYTIDTVSNPIAWYRGLANFSSGNIEDAIKDFKKALLQHPWHAHSHNNLGVCYANTGNLIKARISFQNAILISPFFKQALLNQHAILQFNGNKTLQNGSSD